MTEATKADAGKPLAHLLLSPGGIAIAKALTHGAAKYKDQYNYRRGKGLAYTRLAGAACRHIAAWLCREPVDPESGLSHLAHAGACVIMLADLESLGLGEDDRW